MFVGGECSGVDVDVGIDLDRGHGDVAALQDHADRAKGKTKKIKLVLEININLDRNHKDVKYVLNFRPFWTPTPTHPIVNLQPPPPYLTHIFLIAPYLKKPNVKCLTKNKHNFVVI